MSAMVGPPMLRGGDTGYELGDPWADAIFAGTCVIQGAGINVSRQFGLLATTQIDTWQSLGAELKPNPTGVTGTGMFIITLGVAGELDVHSTAFGDGAVAAVLNAAEAQITYIWT
jgi:hypothetical protein